jgi:hypothetical protein
MLILWCAPFIHLACFSFRTILQDFIPVVDSNAMKVIHIDFPPQYSSKASDQPVKLSTSSTQPPDTSLDSYKISGRERVPPPKELFDFLPDLREEQGFKTRKDVKPLHVVQPEGVSFKVKGHELEWQKWKMHIGMPTLGPRLHHCLIITVQPSVIARASRCLPSRITMTARFDPFCTDSRWRRWSCLMLLLNTPISGSLRLTCE